MNIETNSLSLQTIFYLITGVLIQQMIHLEHASAATTQHLVSDLDLQIIMITRITL